MTYNEEEMLRICEKYGIKTVEKERAPLYPGKEMNEDFSFNEIIKQSISD